MQITKTNKIKTSSHTYLEFTLDSHKLDLEKHTNLHPIIYFKVVWESHIEMTFFLGIPKWTPETKTHNVSNI